MGRNALRRVSAYYTRMTLTGPVMARVCGRRFYKMAPRHDRHSPI